MVKRVPLTAMMEPKEQPVPSLGWSEAEARQFQPLLADYIVSYGQKDKNESDEVWLHRKLSQSLPEKSPEEISALTKDILSEVKRFDDNISSIRKAKAEGKTNEQWFADKMKEYSTTANVTNYGRYLAEIDQTLTQGNTQMYRVLHTMNGGINQNFNLDGFMAEQKLANSFNQQAALENSNYRAVVKAPEPGQTYGKNSFDLEIQDMHTGQRVHQYQVKFGKDAEATIRMLKKGNYNNQRIIVPKDQVEAVQKAFPNKKVSSTIGGTDKVPTKSQGMTKKEMKDLQKRAQEKGKVQKDDWTNYDNEQLLKHLGKQAAVAGMWGSAIPAGFYMAKKVLEGEEIKGEEVAKVAIQGGADAGVKAAATGALKASVEKGAISLIPKGTSTGVLAGVACAGIESAKILYKAGKGEISATKAADMIAETSTATVAGMSTAAQGAAIGAAALSFIPVVGTTVGGFIGGAVGYAAGSKVGKTVYNGVKKAAKVVKSVAKATYHAAKKVVSSVASGVKSFVKSLFSWF